jgi:transcriptional regulator with XRE-family HTH domain
MSILKQLIQTKGYKQKWLAQKLGVSEVTVSNWVSGKTIPKEEHLKKLCDILEINPEILFNNL